MRSILIEPGKKAWSSLSYVDSSEPELFPYLVNLRLQAWAFQPKPRLVPPLVPDSWPSHLNLTPTCKTPVKKT